MNRTSNQQIKPSAQSQNDIQFELRNKLIKVENIF